MRLLVTLLIVCFFGTGEAFSQAIDSTRYRQPVLLSAAGQANDVVILKVLCLRAGLTVKMSPAATADSLDSIGTVILVAGGSSKGLGAAKVDVSGERKRVKALVETAHKRGIPVLTFHIGGEVRRGALSDPFNRQAAESGELIVVAADGDKDGFFRKVAEERKLKYIHIDKYDEAVGVLKDLFGIESNN